MTYLGYVAGIPNVALWKCGTYSEDCLGFIFFTCFIADVVPWKWATYSKHCAGFNFPTCFIADMATWKCTTHSECCGVFIFPTFFYDDVTPWKSTIYSEVYATLVWIVALTSFFVTTTLFSPRNFVFPYGKIIPFCDNLLSFCSNFIFFRNKLSWSHDGLFKARNRKLFVCDSNFGYATTGTCLFRNFSKEALPSGPRPPLCSRRLSTLP